MDIYDHFEQHLKNRLGKDAITADKYKGYARNYDEWVKGQDRKSVLLKRKDKATANEFIEERYGSAEHPTNRVAVDAIEKFQEYLAGRGRLTVFVDTLDEWNQRPHIKLTGGTLVLLATIFGVVTGIAFIAQNLASVPVESMPASGFNVIVAGFGLQNADGSIVQSSVADDVSDLVLSEVQQSGSVDNVRSWRDEGVEHILSKDAATRESQAAQLADRLGGDLVIYGIVRTEGFYSIFEPEFYLSAQFAALEPDFVGADAFGSPISYLADSDDQFEASNELQTRLFVLRQFLRGLSLYFEGAFFTSLGAFESAIDAESQGFELLYIFAGNAAVRDQDVNKALEFYDAALAARPNDQRALIGRGIALFDLAQQVSGNSPPPYNSTLSLPASQGCSGVSDGEPTEPQLLLDLSERCYQEAKLGSDSQTNADIDVKVALGLGQIYTWRSLSGYSDQWTDAETNLGYVINSYATSDPMRQERIRLAAAHANAWLGLRLLAVGEHTVDAVRQAAAYYSAAVDLLQSEVNQSYNRTWIYLYSDQLSAIQMWLDKHSEVTTLYQFGANATPVIAPLQTQNSICSRDFIASDLRGRIYKALEPISAYHLSNRQMTENVDIVPGDYFMIVSNPVCSSEGIAWWKIETLNFASGWVSKDIFRDGVSIEQPLTSPNFTTYLMLDVSPPVIDGTRQLSFNGNAGGGGGCQWRPLDDLGFWYRYGDVVYQVADTETFSPREKVEITVYRPDHTVYHQQLANAEMPGGGCWGGEVGMSGFQFTIDDPPGAWMVEFLGESGRTSIYTLYLTRNFAPWLESFCAAGQNIFVLDGFQPLEPVSIELVEVENGDYETGYQTDVVGRWDVNLDGQGQLVVTFSDTITRNSNRYLLVINNQGEVWGDTDTPFSDFYPLSSCQAARQSDTMTEVAP